ncbi:DUF3857 domain-containing protein [candidate division KSB1 bacterium]|nr:DUF3857 domain-containing protein [candidate division KSB1 bacterium]
MPLTALSSLSLFGVSINKKRKMWGILFCSSLVLLSLYLGCAGRSSWTDPLPPELVSNLDDKEYQDYGAVILLDEAELQIMRGDIRLSERERHRIVKILNDRGYGFANVTIPFSSQTEISNIRGRTITPDGGIQPLDPSEIYEITAHPEFIFYSDVKAKRFTLPAVQDGSIIEYRWNERVSGYTNWNTWTFQSSVPVLQSRYRLSMPSEWDFKWTSQNIQVEFDSIPAPQGFNRVYEWRAENIAPLIPKVGMPSLNKVMGSLTFSPVGISDWQDVARWYHGLVKERIKPTHRIARKARELIAGAENQREQLERLAEFVRDHVRYVAISIGIGGYQPHFAQEVLTKRYGDCKDKVTLLIALAQSVNIKVEPVIISTWQNGKVDTTVASQTHFNHLIARATLDDSSRVWVDATDKMTPFGELPWYDQDRLVWIVRDDGSGVWERTPANAASDNMTVRHWQLALDGRGAAGSLEIRYAGAEAHDFRRLFWSHLPKQRREWVERQIRSRFPQARITDVRIDSVRKIEQPVRIRAQFRTRFEYPLHLPLDRFFASDWHLLLADSSRVYPIDIRYPSVSKDQLYMQWHDEYHIEHNIENSAIQDSILHWHQTVNTTQGLHLAQELRLFRRRIDTLELADVKAVFDDIAQQQQQWILIRKTDKSN